MRVRTLRTIFAAAGLALMSAAAAFAQTDAGRLEIGVQVSSAVSRQFDGAELGVGGRAAWYPLPSLGLESEFNFYPSEFPDEAPFSRGRVEGLFGMTLGPRLALVRPFVRVRSGFLRVREASGPRACILIFPPPLSCTLAGGRTLPAFDIGAGVEMFANGRALVRIDVGDRLLKYPGPSIDDSGVRRDDSFLGHDLRVAAGVALRF